ncbi:MAG: hypothetical protein HOP08_00240 [Cyclobacteriaceae bacterium]|nr:hypothetical protein [Cyclobacteriaceae bacterium]
MRKILLFLLIILLAEACTSGKAALKKGDYYEAVIESINRLRGSPDNKKAIAVLTQGYPLSIEYIEANIQNGINADDPRKWRNAVKGYEQINYINDQIKTSLGAMKIISKPATRFKELADAKSKAAEESYQEGITSLMKNTRTDAKVAYFNFKDAAAYEPGYRESIEMMTQAEFNATLRVAYEEINASRFNYGSFQPIIIGIQRQFLSFKPISQKDTVPPHQNLRIIFNGYREDPQASITTSTEEVKKDVKTGEKKGADGKTQDIMTNVAAKITYYRKVKRATSSAMMSITEVSSDAILQNQSVDGNVAWQYDWATYSGDIRALNTNQVNLCKLKESYPAEQYLYNQSMSSLKTNLSSQLRSFYSQY